MLILSVFFFFFKQKTAYEMRISDWSSDVCSSDLVTLHGPFESHDLIPFFYVGGCARAAAVARLDRVDRHLAAVPAGMGGVAFLRPCGRGCVTGRAAAAGARCAMAPGRPCGLLTAPPGGAKGDRKRDGGGQRVDIRGNLWCVQHKKKKT